MDSEARNKSNCNASLPSAYLTDPQLTAEFHNTIGEFGLRLGRHFRRLVQNIILFNPTYVVFARVASIVPGVSISKPYRRLQVCGVPTWAKFAT